MHVVELCPVLLTYSKERPICRTGFRVLFENHFHLHFPPQNPVEDSAPFPLLGLGTALTSQAEAKGEVCRRKKPCTLEASLLGGDKRFGSCLPASEPESREALTAAGFCAWPWSACSVPQSV